MNRSPHRACLGLVIAAMLAACNRHVVIEPEMVGARNQADWTIVSAPNSALPPPQPPPQPPPPPPPSSTGDTP